MFIVQLGCRGVARAHAYRGRTRPAVDEVRALVPDMFGVVAKKALGP